MSKPLTKIVVSLGILIVIIIGGYISIFGLSKKASFDKPVPIMWSKDVCAQCGMSIVDKFHAAEIVNPKTQKVYKFDDIGGVVVWAKHNHGLDWLKKIMVWVTSSKTGKWLNAKESYYIKGQTTPMGYGLGAVSGHIPGSLDWQQATKYLLKKRKSLLSGKKIKMKNMKSSNGKK